MFFFFKKHKSNVAACSRFNNIHFLLNWCKREQCCFNLIMVFIVYSHFWWKRSGASNPHNLVHQKIHLGLFEYIYFHFLWHPSLLSMAQWVPVPKKIFDFRVWEVGKGCRFATTLIHSGNRHKATRHKCYSFFNTWFLNTHHCNDITIRQLLTQIKITISVSSIIEV